jgi:hypothetical protein
LHGRRQASKVSIFERPGQLVEASALLAQVETGMSVPRDQQRSGQQVETIVARACVITKLHEVIIPRL